MNPAYFSAAGSGLVLVVSALLASRHKKQFFTYWTLAYGCFFVACVMDILSIRHRTAPMTILSAGTLCVGCFFFLASGLAIQRRRTFLFPAVLSGGALLTTIVLVAAAAPFAAAFAPPILLAVFAFMRLGFVTLRSSAGMSGTRWIAVPYIAKGLSLLTFPFATGRPVEPFAYGLDSLLVLLLGLGTMIFLLESNARETQLLIETNRSAVFTVSPSGEILSWNAGAERLFGFSDVDVLGQNWIVLAAASAGRPLPDARPLSENVGTERSATSRRKDGTQFWAGFVYCPIHSGSGEVEAYAVLAMDISERRRLEEERLRLASVIEQSGDAILLTDAVGSVLFANPSFKKRAMSRGSPIIGEKLFASLPPATRAEAEEAMAAGTGWTARITERDARGMSVVEDISLAPIRSDVGQVTNFVFSARDVTRVVEVEALRESEQALRESNRQKSEFLGVLSHELRNPLAPIRNSVYILRENGSLDEQGRHAALIIERQVGHLAHLIDDLLDVTRISQGKIRLHNARLDLVEIVRREVDDVRSALTGREMELVFPAQPMWVDGDPVRLAQVLSNLLGNAEKFTPAGGRIRVSLAESGPDAVLVVEDTGAGMDTETLGRIFTPFAQADRTLDRSRGGLGLGLALVKALVELHGGTVRAESEGPGRGTRITVRLPLLQGAGDLPTPAAQPQLGVASARRVLVIEDNVDAANSLCELLTGSGYLCAAAYGGAQGVARAREFHPEIVICDIGLPEMDGYAVARTLRQDPAQSSAFLMAVSGYAQPQDKQQALEAGFDAHLSKPVEINALKHLLAEAPTSKVRPAALS